MSALGVPRETVRQDYLLSNVYRADEVEDYGSMEAYIRDGLGISDEEIEHLRAELLESPS